MLTVLSFLLFAAASGDPGSGRLQVFIAPSGEPFRVYGDDAPYPLVDWFAGADANGDGQLDFAEFNADFLRFFAELDVNQDGSIDGIERARYENEIAPETQSGPYDERLRAREEKARKPDFGGSDQGASTVLRPKPSYSNTSGAAQYEMLGQPEPVAAMDMLMHGRITATDASNAARLCFRQLDSQNRGYLTLDTLPETYAESGGGGRGGKKRN